MPRILMTLSALCGGVGTALMYKYSVTLTQLTPYTNPELTAQVNAQNAKMLTGQRIGLGFLIVSIILALISAWLS